MAGDIHYQNVTLLLLFQGTNGSTIITDSSLYPYTNSNNISPVTMIGNAQLSTAQALHGSSSLYLDGSGDYVHFVAHSRLVAGTGDFTLEYWIRPTRSGQTENHIELRASDTAIPLWLGKSSAEAVRTYDGSSVRATGTAMSLNTWQHIAWSRSGGTNRVFLDGVEQYNFSSSFNLSAPIFRIGSNIDGSSEQAQCYIDSIRYTVGVGRYTAGFTPAEFYTYAGQITGNITESLDVTKWLVKATKITDGKLAGINIATGATYTINCNTLEACIVTIEPYVDYLWSASKVAALDDIVMASDPVGTPHLFKVTTGGTFAGTEASWNLSGTTTQGTAVLTYLVALDDGMFSIHGPRIPA